MLARIRHESMIQMRFCSHQRTIFLARGSNESPVLVRCHLLFCDAMMWSAANNSMADATSSVVSSFMFWASCRVVAFCFSPSRSTTHRVSAPQIRASTLRIGQWGKCESTTISIRRQG